LGFSCLPPLPATAKIPILDAIAMAPSSKARLAPFMTRCEEAEGTATLER
jgi:hypothetical protein